MIFRCISSGYRGTETSLPWPVCDNARQQTKFPRDTTWRCRLPSSLVAGGTLINNLPAPHGQQSGLAALCYDPFFEATANEEKGRGLGAVCQCRILSCNCAARNCNCKPCSQGCVHDAPSAQYSNSQGRVAIDLPAKFCQSLGDSIVVRRPNEHL